MQKKLTITMDEAVYDGLHKVVGPRKISRFLEDLARPLVLPNNLESAYREMAADRAREAEALEWAEATIGDIDHATRRSVVGELRSSGRRGNPKKKAGRHRQQ